MASSEVGPRGALVPCTTGSIRLTCHPLDGQPSARPSLGCGEETQPQGRTAALHLRTPLLHHQEPAGLSSDLERD